MRAAFLGLGRMGSVIARHLLRAGYELSVWNRSPGAAEELAAEGAQAAASPAACVRDAQAVFTMLLDDAALRSVLFEQGVLDAMPRGAVHLSLSTISVALARELQQAHAARGQRMLGCPVFGRPNIAAEGRLWLAVAGAPATVDEFSPVLETFSRGMTIVGPEPSQAHAAKLAGNFLISAMIASLSEGISVAEQQGIDAALYLELVNSALFQSPFYAAYGKVMVHPPEQVAAAVRLGQKDTRLFQQAAQAVGVPTPLAEQFQQRFSDAIAQGAGDHDWAAGYLEEVRRAAREARV